jgi:hypothetical protein
MVARDIKGILVMIDLKTKECLNCVNWREHLSNIDKEETLGNCICVFHESKVTSATHTCEFCVVRAKSVVPGEEPCPPLK